MATSHASSGDLSGAISEHENGDSLKRKSPTNLNFKLPIKLDRNNYNFWKLQVLDDVHAFDLEDFMLNPSKCPPKYIQHSNEDSGEVVQLMNEEYVGWKKTDQLFVCWLFSTLSESVFGLVTHCTTAFDI
ncbi:hypothetical protein Ddye_019861 [Dipteronia dyeriana]|uniref:Retrotransposon Copia-like N-terminal domain-containing protein n=1 Tax=Dipteronia dyeriana TaxID=168575 RepID=A0AAD9TYQ9_9ROSI|nr:hypothetical protein Ddye_019861 [Dipteronia dyeriana]